ncbi:MAG: D-alanine--D-alanine ligase family protein [Mesorhizobium sp.]
MTSANNKLRVAVLFGGKSSEHDVSVMSGTNVMRAMDPARYDIVPVFVTPDGRWLLGAFADGEVTKPETGLELALVPGGKGRIVAIAQGETARELPAIDALFPVLHGLGGEDGSVQGLADVAGVPLVGCGIVGSANALDKDIAKRLMTEAGVPNARSVTVLAGSAPPFEEIAATLGLPLFIKPARQGSSVGVSKVADAASYEAALVEGFRHDPKLVAEEFIKGREIEFAVLERPDGSLFVSRPGEIAPAESHGFYTYDAKYIDADGASLIVPAQLSSGDEARMQAIAARAFRAVGCDGMARVDFFMTEDGRALINEINTIPGFTNISMYPKAMEASGIPYPQLIDRLIEHGLTRAGR